MRDRAVAGHDGASGQTSVPHVRVFASGGCRFPKLRRQPPTIFENATGAMMPHGARSRQGEAPCRDASPAFRSGVNGWKNMRRVVIESPYAGRSCWRIVALFQRARNRRYARQCVRDSLMRGEAPIASHLLYTQPGILRDGIASERQQGIEAGLAWRTVADASVVYVDRGISKGMVLGIEAAESAGIPVERRTLKSK